MSEIFIPNQTTDSMYRVLYPSSSTTLERHEENPTNIASDVSACDFTDRKTRNHSFLKKIVGSLALTGLSLLGSVELAPNLVTSQDLRLVYDITTSNTLAAINSLTTKHSAAPVIDMSLLIANYRLNDGLFKSSQLGWYSSVWPSSRALDALYTRSLLPNGTVYKNDFNQSLQAINNNYWSNSIDGESGYVQGINNFRFKSSPPLVDDNLWMGLINMRQYQQDHKTSELTRSEEIFQLAYSQWDQTAGGIYWQVQMKNAPSHIRAVVSNASAVRLGIELYKTTKNSFYLRTSEKIFNWLNSTLFDPSTGLYDDHINYNGVLDPAKYTYVQGIMVGAMASLSQIDSANYPLSNAIELTKRSIAYFDSHQSYGDPAFDAIWSQNILWLASIYKKPIFTKLVQESVDNSLAAAPHQTANMLFVAGEVELQSLDKLPPTKYNLLF